MRRLLRMLAVPACLILATQIAIAQACSIDGTPTVRVNGYLAIINRAVPIGANLRVWAPFVLSFPLHTGRGETLSELPQAIPLPREAFKTPWRWNFGDGSTIGRGMAVHHTFEKPGIYKITVSCYFPSHKFWYVFDALQVRVLRG